jgi:hypothetical protein
MMKVGHIVKPVQMRLCVRECSSGRAIIAPLMQVYRLQADAPRGFYRLPKRVDVGEVNDSCDLQGI